MGALRGSRTPQPDHSDHDQHLHDGRDNRNASDSIFTQAGGPTAILAVTELGSGYTSAITVGVR